MDHLSQYIKNQKQINSEFAATFSEVKENTRVGLKVRALRRSMNLSQRAFAELIGKPQSTVARIEHGDVKASLDTLQIIADKTGKQLEIDFV